MATLVLRRHRLAIRFPARVAFGAAAVVLVCAVLVFGALLLVALLWTLVDIARWSIYAPGAPDLPAYFERVA